MFYFHTINISSPWQVVASRDVHGIPSTRHGFRLQLGLRLCQVLDLLEPIKVVEAVRVQQRAARLDRLAADDFLDRQLYLFPIDSRLCHTQKIISIQIQYPSPYG